jgi:Ala-tRNA(Pro) deacylase
MSTVTEYLSSKGVPFAILRHAEVRTALGEAYALGVPPEIVAKTVVLDVGGAHVLAVLPASRRLDMHRLREALRDHHVRLASEDELSRDFPQYELGSFPALGSLISAPVVIDPDFIMHDDVVLAGGEGGESIRVRTRDLLAIEHALVTPITERPEEDALVGESMKAQG